MYKHKLYTVYVAIKLASFLNNYVKFTVKGSGSWCKVLFCNIRTISIIMCECVSLNGSSSNYYDMKRFISDQHHC